jgi:hypothetical protein
MDHPLPTTALPDDAERLERQTRALAELVELGMRVARVVTQQAEDAKFVGGDGGELFTRITRTVRQAIALENRIVENARKRAQQNETGPTRKIVGRQDQTIRPQDPARRVAAAASRRDDRADAEDADDLLGDLYERLDDPDIEAELGQRSVEDILASICRDLGIVLELSDGLASAPDLPAGIRKLSSWIADLAVAPGDRIGGNNRDAPPRGSPPSQPSAGLPRAPTGRDPP